MTKGNFSTVFEKALKDKMRDLRASTAPEVPQRAKYEEVDNREAVLAAKSRETGLKKLLDAALGGRDLGEFYRSIGENLFANDTIKSYIQNMQHTRLPNPRLPEGVASFVAPDLPGLERQLQSNRARVSNSERFTKFFTESIEKSRFYNVARNQKRDPKLEEEDP